MQKLEDVVIPMNRNDIKYWVGGEQMEIRPLPVYSDIVCEFLEEVSGMLRKDVEARMYPDILTFAFWCRRANIKKLKENYVTPYFCVGKGLVFHVAPSNVPINFAFSLVFGMLAGNANVVRVSQKDFPQIPIVCRILNQVLENKKYEVLKKQTQVVSYGHSREINDYFSKECHARVIWGGDATIEELRHSPIGTRTTEITFADRYSFGIMSETAVSELSEEEVLELAGKFYKDTYLMDQNACSSPHLILWKDAMADNQGKKKFWNAVAEVAKKYDLPEKKVMDKYTMLCEQSAVIEKIRSVERYNNLLYVVKLLELPQELEMLRGKFGLFYEANIADYKDVLSKVTPKMQTCVTYGVDKQELAKVIVESHTLGIDRIVQVGDSMNIGVYWDGMDVIGQLSRQIVVE